VGLMRLGMSSCARNTQSGRRHNVNNMTLNLWLGVTGGNMTFIERREQFREAALGSAVWVPVIALWICAVWAIRSDEQFLIAIALMVLNFEITKRGRKENSFAEYLNAVFFHVLLYFYLGAHSMEWGEFRIEIVFLLEATIVALINVRWGFLSLKAMVRFLVLASVVTFPFTLWERAYVPRFGMWHNNIPLEFYYYWMMPIETLLISAPFLSMALAKDLMAIRGGTENSKMLDVYYCYAIPLLAFGLFPGIGISHQANCDLNSTYVAISGIVVLILAGLMLSLFTHRKSILLASALASIPLGFNRCVTEPVSETILIVCGIMLLTWRWLPKGPARGA